MARILKSNMSLFHSIGCLLLLSAVIQVAFAGEAEDALRRDNVVAEMQLGKKSFRAFVADTDNKRARGLMYVTSLSLDEGMIFVFDREQAQSFWMKNTFVPLSLGFFNAKGVLQEMANLQPVASLMDSSPQVYTSIKPAMFVLEMSQGWFKNNQITIGSKLKLTRPSKSKKLNSALSTKVENVK